MRKISRERSRDSCSAGFGSSLSCNLSGFRVEKRRFQNCRRCWTKCWTNSPRNFALLPNFCCSDGKIRAEFVASLASERILPSSEASESSVETVSSTENESSVERLVRFDIPARSIPECPLGIRCAEWLPAGFGPWTFSFLCILHKEPPGVGCQKPRSSLWLGHVRTHFAVWFLLRCAIASW